LGIIKDPTMKAEPDCGQRTVLPMKRLTYLLVLLLISAQAEDAWAVVPVLPSAPLADDNHEYLASRPTQAEESSSRQKRAFAGFKPQTADYTPVRTGIAPKQNLAAPFGPLPLYVFMSLQI
jgi:hypothetical protein